jgi:hypothetical protein
MSKGTAMNKQIEQLALQCGAWHQVYGNRNFMIDEHFDIEKFARLIVRECAEVASDWDGAHYVGTAIEKHFGVEE